MRATLVLVLAVNAMLATAQGNGDPTKSPETTSLSTSPTVTPVTSIPTDAKEKTPVPTMKPEGNKESSAPPLAENPSTSPINPPQNIQPLTEPTTTPTSTITQQTQSPPSDIANTSTNSSTGIIIGCVAGVLALIGLVLFFCKRAKKSSDGVSFEENNLEDALHSTKDSVVQSNARVRVLSPELHPLPPSAPIKDAPQLRVSTSKEAAPHEYTNMDSLQHETEVAPSGFFTWQSSHQIEVPKEKTNSMDNLPVGRTSWSSDVGSNGTKSSPASSTQDYSNPWTGAALSERNSFGNESRNSYTSENRNSFTSRNSYGSDIRDECGSYMSDGFSNNDSIGRFSSSSMDSYTRGHSGKY